MANALEDFQVNTKIKLSGLWAATMFCYLYCDYFELYTAGKLQSMLDGKMVPLGEATASVLLKVAIMMALPSLMVALSLFLPATINRWTNVLVGLLYTAIMGMVLTMTNQPFYQFFAAIEMLLTLTIVWQAWRWPRQGFLR